MLRHGSIVRGGVAGLAGLAVAGLAGCGSGATPASSSASSTAVPSASQTGPASATSPSSASSAAVSPSPSVTPSVAPKIAVARIGAQRADLRAAGMPAEFGLTPMTGGDVISRKPEDSTLGNCGYSFTTDAFRVARHQVEVTAQGRYAGISNEVVAYDTAEHAALALGEWRNSVTGCRTTVFFPPPVTGAHTLRYDSETLVQRGDLPVPDHAWTSARETDRESGLHFSATVVLQQHGRYLDIVWASSLSQRAASFTKQQTAAIEAVALATGRRLAAL